MGIEDDDAPAGEDRASVDYNVMSVGSIDIPVTSFPIAVGSPVLDGLVDEDFWQQAQKFDLDVELYPERFGTPIVDTAAYIAVSETHVFIAFEAFDPDMTLLRSAARSPDGVKGDDYVSLIIDPTGSGVKKFEFRINPHGSLTDVLQDTVSDRYIYDWDTEWSGAAAIGDAGYSAEIAIPLESIKFPVRSSSDATPWLIVLKRSYPRRVGRTFGKIILVTKPEPVEPAEEETASSTTETSVADENSSIGEPATVSSATNPVPVNYGVDTPQAILPATRLRLRSADSTHRLQRIDFTPYYIVHKEEERDPGGDFEQVDDHGVQEIGFTSKLRFGTDRLLSLTVNPNLTHIEADIARESINNPFNIFQPEKREFFQADTELYSTMFPMVYTRNIISPTAGASYSQTGADTTAGFFWVGDRETEVIMPDNLGSEKVTLMKESESAAARVQKVFGKQAIGLLGTARTGGDDYHNVVGGIDGLYTIGIDDKMRYQLLFSDTQYPEDFADDLCEEDDCTTIAPPDICLIGSCSVNPYVLRTNFDNNISGHALRVNYKHDGPDELYWFNYFDVANDFRGDLGFARTTDFRGFNLAYGRKWYVTVPGDDGLSRIQSYLLVKNLKSSSGEKLEESYSLLAEFRGSRQTVLRLAPTVKRRAVNRINQNSLELGRNAPLFDEKFLAWFYELAPSVKWTLNFDGRYGDIANADNLILGTMREFKPRFRYRVENFEFRAEGVFREFDVDQGQLYEEQFYTLGMTYRKNKTISHRFLVLHDITRRNLENWIIDEPEKEKETTIEYTFIYNPNKNWTVLSGFKYGSDANEVFSETSVTDREFFIKIEGKFSSIVSN